MLALQTWISVLSEALESAIRQQYATNSWSSSPLSDQAQGIRCCIKAPHRAGW